MKEIKQPKKPVKIDNSESKYDLAIALLSIGIALGFGFLIFFR